MPDQQQKFDEISQRLEVIDLKLMNAGNAERRLSIVQAQVIRLRSHVSMFVGLAGVLWTGSRVDGIAEFFGVYEPGWLSRAVIHGALLVLVMGPYVLLEKRFEKRIGIEE